MLRSFLRLLSRSDLNAANIAAELNVLLRCLLGLTRLSCLNLSRAVLLTCLTCVRLSLALCAGVFSGLDCRLLRFGLDFLNGLCFCLGLLLCFGLDCELHSFACSLCLLRRLILHGLNRLLRNVLLNRLNLIGSGYLDRQR